MTADWKCARVSAIYKHDSKLDLNNYRPISVLPVVSKFFEKVVFDQAYAFLNKNNLLSDIQSGFRPLHSTLTAMLDVTDKWYTNMDSGLINAVLFIDLKKAFDTIDHNILLQKLTCYGFNKETINLFRNYLSDRTQITVINNTRSDTRKVTCGVPQGSILGPLLFLIYINDLPNSELVSDGHLFADDTNLTFADSNPDKLISVLNDDLKTLQNWLNLNKLSLNAIKTKCMFMASRQKLSTIPEEPNIAISGNKIERVRSYKCLGLKLDESLTWEHHVSTIISKVSKVIGVLRRLKPLLPQSTLTMIYNSLAQPYFDYCSIVWDSLGKGLGQKLQRLQNRAARIITESDYNIRSSDILTSLNWTNLETRRTQQFKTFMYKTVNNMVPSYLSGKFTSTSMIHEHSLRGSNHKLFVPRPLTESLKKSFSYRGATLWNDIPVELTSVQSLAEFKSKIS